MATRKSRKAWPRILLAVDFSPASRKAFDAARGLAKDLDAGIVLVHVTPKVLRKDPDPKGKRGPYLTPPEAALKDATRLSSQWAEELRKDDIFVKALNPVGIPASTLVDVAVKHDCSVIVLSTLGRSKLKSMLVGSVAREVIRTSPLPVLAVPARKQKGPKGEKVAKPTKAIVAAIDFSPESELAFQAAVGLAHDLKAVVRALHVVSLNMPVAPFPLGAEYDVEIMEAEEEASFEELSQMASKARRHKVGVLPSVQVGHPATAILTEARATGATLIVMGTHGKSASRQFFLGSVAQAVVQAADRPVLIIPGKRKRGHWRR